MVCRVHDASQLCLHQEAVLGIAEAEHPFFVLEFAFVHGKFGRCQVIHNAEYAVTSMFHATSQRIHGGILLGES
eukprot:1840118-Pyramimonas_sp.AAC.1